MRSDDDDDGNDDDDDLAGGEVVSVEVEEDDGGVKLSAGGGRNPLENNHHGDKNGNCLDGEDKDKDEDNLLWCPTDRDKYEDKYKDKYKERIKENYRIKDEDKPPVVERRVSHCQGSELSLHFAHPSVAPGN